MCGSTMANLTQDENLASIKKIPALLCRSKWKYTQPVDMFFSFKHFSVHHCFPGEYSDPSRPSQGDFPSSAVQTLTSRPGGNWYLYWYHCRTFSSCWLDIPDLRTVEYLSLHIIRCNYNWIYVMLSVVADTDFHKCGQTSRPVVETQIPTSGNFEENIHTIGCSLGCLYSRFHNIYCEWNNFIFVYCCHYALECDNFYLLLHVDFPPACVNVKLKFKAMFKDNRAKQFHWTYVYCDTERLCLVRGGCSWH